MVATDELEALDDATDDDADEADDDDADEPCDAATVAVFVFDEQAEASPTTTSRVAADRTFANLRLFTTHTDA